MEIRLMRRPRRMLILGALLALAVALAITLMSAGGKLPATAKAAVKQVAVQPGAGQQVALKHVTHHATHHAVRAKRATAESTSGVDTDNVQSGDQTTPDAAGAAS